MRDQGVGNGRSKAWVDSSVAAQNGGVGFYIQDGVLTVSNSLSAGNSDGFRAEFVSQLAAHDCVASDNTNGFLVYLATMTVSSSLATRNSADGIATNYGTVYVSGNTVTNNSVGLHVIGAAIMESIGNNMVRGNTTNVSGTVTTVGAN